MKLCSINKKIIVLILVIFLQSFLGGCVYRVDIQKLAIIVAMGVDSTPDDRYKVSFQILQASSNKQSSTMPSAGKGDGAGVLYFEGMGETIYDAIGNVPDKVSKKLHYGQLKIFIIGERAAERGIANIVDFLGRFNEIRINIPLFITRDEASSIIKVPSSENSVPANTMEDMVLKQIMVGHNPIIYLSQLIEVMSSEGRYPILSVMTLNKKNESPDAADFSIDGMAVFEGDKLTDYLNSREVKGYQYIKGKLNKGSSIVKMDDDSKIAVEFVRTSSKVETEIVKGKVAVTINVNQECSVIEMQGKLNPAENPDILEQIGIMQAKNIEDLIRATLSVIQKDIGKDIIDIGGEVYRQHPKEWKNVKEEWKDIFPDLNIKVNADVKVRGTGLLSKPAF